ncbi:hypothetical protein E2C01_050835 [Portunus trituberculatus]|uniref:Uncharacterized protein n=1 Tax=Portunus trituberculatus TaxID=210409 RepID=A0A5B7GH62_PORTR|nr:hypothetical protein [Portunus trituberculatus]
MMASEGAPSHGVIMSRGQVAGDVQQESPPSSDCDCVLSYRARAVLDLCSRSAGRRMATLSPLSTGSVCVHTSRSEVCVGTPVLTGVPLAQCGRAGEPTS